MLMNKRYLLIALSSILTLALLYLSAVNAQMVAFSAFGRSTEIPLGLITVVSFVAGGLTLLPAVRSKAKEIKSEKIQTKWVEEDAKLTKEIASDREKQLEAKIVTLEAALKQALKKKS